MIATLRGILSEISADFVILDVGGVGYRVFVSQNTLNTLPPVGEEAFLRIYTHVREDALLLYGFASTAEKDAFGLLTAVSGVGPRLALGVLSVFSTSSLTQVVFTQDAKALTRVPGVGKKTAERILLELRDKMKMNAADAGISDTVAALPQQGSAYEAVEALLSLGYTRLEAEQAVEWAGKRCEAATPATAELVKLALKRLATSA